MEFMKSPNRIMKNLYDIFTPEAMHEHGNTQMEIAYDSIRDGDMLCAIHHIQELLLDELSYLSNDVKEMSLFRFVSISKENALQALLRDIEKNQITLCDPSGFNDPMDPILNVWANLNRHRGEDSYECKLSTLLKNSLNNFRMCCLSSQKNGLIPYCNPLMWAHYADKHQGICIKYHIIESNLCAHCNDRAVLKIGAVRYRNHKTMSDYITLDNALLAKSEVWEYEHEYRLIYYQIGKIQEKTKGFLSLPNFKVEAVYVGYKIDERNLKILKDVCQRNRIPIFQMQFEMADITKLRTEKIE